MTSPHVTLPPPASEPIVVLDPDEEWCRSLMPLAQRLAKSRRPAERRFGRRLTLALDSYLHLDQVLGKARPPLPWRRELARAFERAQTCETFRTLTTERHFPVIAAAGVLGKPASALSGKKSLLARYQSKGFVGLINARFTRERKRPCRREGN